MVYFYQKLEPIQLANFLRIHKEKHAQNFKTSVTNSYAEKCRVLFVKILLTILRIAPFGKFGVIFIHFSSNVEQKWHWNRKNSYILDDSFSKIFCMPRKLQWNGKFPIHSTKELPAHV